MGLFSESVVWPGLGDGLYEGVLSADWAQGRTAFGGILAGIGLQAMQQEVPTARTLRSFQVTFVGPARVGAAKVVVTKLREGRSLSMLEARLIQEGSVCALMVGCFGQARPSNYAMTGPVAPEMPAPDSIGAMPYIEGMMPSFTQHIDFRWTSQHPPFSGGPEANIQGWCRLREETAVTMPALLTLLDAWPPPVLVQLDAPAPASSVTWMINVFSELPAGGAAPGSWWRYASETLVAGDGYTDATASMWDAEGRLFAQSRQMIAEFSGK